MRVLSERSLEPSKNCNRLGFLMSPGTGSLSGQASAVSLLLDVKEEEPLLG